MFDIFEKLQHISWWKIVKSLAFEGGASSTKWVYLACAAVVNACLVAMVASLCWVYVRSYHHDVNIALATLIGSTIGVVVAIPANSANLRRQVNAKGSSETTPLSSGIDASQETTS